MHIYVWKTLLTYTLSITTLNTKQRKKEKKMEGGKEREWMETLKIQQYILEQGICKGHVMYHTCEWK